MDEEEPRKPLTKEEKKAKKEAKKMAKFLAAEEARKTRKAEELHRELAAQARSLASIDKAMKNMMLKIKIPIYRRDIEALWNMFERAVDKKDSLLNYTLHLINVADDQYWKSVASTCNIFDNLIMKFFEDFERLKNNYNRDLANTLTRKQDEIMALTHGFQVSESHLQLMIYYARHTTDRELGDRRGYNFVTADDELAQHANLCDKLVAFLENNYNETWEEYKNVIKNYVAHSVEIQKESRKINIKMKKTSDIIASQHKKILGFEDLLEKLNKKLDAYGSGAKQSTFRQNRDRYRVACFNMKKRVVEHAAKDKRQIEILVEYSDDAINYLQSVLQKQEKILRVAANCRRYETNCEKVLPFGTSEPHASTQKAKNTTHDEAEHETDANSMPRMWQRVSKAELSRRALICEKKLLEEENEKLERMLQDRKEKGEQPVKCICTVKKLNLKSWLDIGKELSGSLSVSAVSSQ